MAQKAHSLSHTKWMCKYHIVFTPKYRRKVIYNQYRSSLGEIFHRLCSYKGVEIIEGHLMPDHVHMLVSIPPRISVASFMGYLKGKSALMMFDKHANLKYKFGNRHFWAEDHYENTIIHSDQGWQYQHDFYHHFLEDKGIQPSMSRKGNSPDNGMMESFFGILKNEMFYCYEKTFQSL